MAAPVVGNQDYRGYLNYLGKQGDVRASNLLKFNVGNDAGFNPRQYTGLTQDFLDYNTQLYGQYNQLNTPSTPTPNMGSIYGGVPAPAYAPKLDVAGVKATARQQAEGAVTPYYTGVLNQFLAQQAAIRKQTEAQAATNKQNLEDTLKQTLEQNQITQGRTTEDVAQNQADINTSADQFQTDTGQAFDTARLDLARGTSTGGLGQQKREGAQIARNTTEKRQEEQFQQQRQQQDLFKTRTFEDLARSGTLATGAKEKGVKQVQFDLESYITNSGLQEADERNKMEKARQDEINQKAQGFAAEAYGNYIRNIVNPAQRLAGQQQYGASF